jgi:rSAM/selenodomain-associated transferase 1
LQRGKAPGLPSFERLARHHDTVVIFARAPRLGAVKRRLAAEIGARAALRFHTGTLTRLLRMLCADRRFRTVLAVTPDRARLRLPHRVTRMAQGSGDLGQRMERAFQRFPHCRVAIIGCDIPDANATDVANAFRSLGRADAVFGPAADGGYWLVGMNPRRPAHPFGEVRWSTQHALADTLANFTHRRVTLLRTLHDVDTAADCLRALSS